MHESEHAEATRQVYILSADDDVLPLAYPEYVRLILGVPAEIVRVIDIVWNCSKSNHLVAFDHSIADGVVKLTATLPACAKLTIARVIFERFAAILTPMQKRPVLIAAAAAVFGLGVGFYLHAAAVQHGLSVRALVGRMIGLKSELQLRRQRWTRSPTV